MSLQYDVFSESAYKDFSLEGTGDVLDGRTPSGVESSNWGMASGTIIKDKVCVCCVLLSSALCVGVALVYQFILFF